MNTKIYLTNGHHKINQTNQTNRVNQSNQTNEISKTNHIPEFKVMNFSSDTFTSRDQLKNAKRIIVKIGSAVIANHDNGIALGRLASIIDQICRLQLEGKEMIVVSSGSITLGNQHLNEIKTSMSLLKSDGTYINDARAAAAIGQSRLMSMYGVLFSSFSVNIAQVLVTKSDFSLNSINRINLRKTIRNLLKLKIIPIINTNDVVVSPNEPDFVCEQNVECTDNNIALHDNDALAALISFEIEADILILMSDVDGVYNKSPSNKDAKLFSTFTPNHMKCNEAGKSLIEFGSKSKVGKGGMESKISSALWALSRGTSVVVCNGFLSNTITSIIEGKKVGTFFALKDTSPINLETLAEKVKKASQVLLGLTGEKRCEVLLNIAHSLKQNKMKIFEANQVDIEKAKKNGLSKVLLDRLKITESKLDDLVDGFIQVAEKAKNCLGKILRKTQISENLILKQITVPIGVLLVIFESRPDSLPQISGLSLASGNGLLLKGGSEALHTNTVLTNLIKHELSKYHIENAIYLLNTREEISELLSLKDKIDLIIPRGSNKLVQSIKEQSKFIPVLGHSEGVCHVYLDEQLDLHKAFQIVYDSKCDYPSACNAMETLLIHKSLLYDKTCSRIINHLKKNGVEIFIGPKLSHHFDVDLPKTDCLSKEYSNLQCTLELVEDIDQAIEHINQYGSSHTDVIVTENEMNAQKFIKFVDSACVFHNCSSRFADGYRFGLGAEVGISTGKIHARGPVGVEGLLSTKWVLHGTGHTVTDFNLGKAHYMHKEIN